MGKNTNTRLYMESKNIKLINVESGIVVARGWQMGEMRRCWPKGTNFQLCKVNKC